MVEVYGNHTYGLHSAIRNLSFRGCNVLELKRVGANLGFGKVR
jgi:hypothetical protein